MEGIDINLRFELLSEDDMKLLFFSSYSKTIDQRIRDKFPWIPSDFKLKPVLKTSVASMYLQNRYDFFCLRLDFSFVRMSCC